MALLTEGGFSATVLYKHGPPDGGRADHFLAAHEVRRLEGRGDAWYERLTKYRHTKFGGWKAAAHLVRAPH